MTAPRRTGIPAVPAIEQADLHSFLIAIRKVLERLEGVVSDLDASTAANLSENVTSINSDIDQLIADLASTSASKGASLIGVQDAGGLTAQTNVEAYLAENRNAIDTLEAGRAVKSQTWEQSWLIQYPEDGDYRVVIDAAVARTITEVTTRSSAGTATLTVKINTTALGGTANSVSTSEQSQAHASANAVAVGDDIVLTFSSTSSAENVSVKISGTLTLS